MKNLEYQVNNMTCGGCAVTIESVLKGELGLKHATVNVPEKKLLVSIPKSFDARRIVSTLADIGFEASLIRYKDKSRRATNILMYYFLVGLTTSLTGGILMLLHSLPLAINFFPALCAGVAIPGILLAGFWIFKNAWNALFKQKTVTMDVLFALSLGVIIATSLASLFIPALGLPMLCHSGLMIVGFRNLGKFLNDQVSHNIGKQAVVRPKFSKHYTLQNGKKVRMEEIRQGMAFVLEKGDIIPVDGTILQGNADIDENRVTGELFPEKKIVGMPAYSGTKLTAGHIIVKAEKGYFDSLYHLTNQLLKEAIMHPPRLQTVTNRIIRYYIPAMMALASVIGVGLAFLNPIQGLIAGISILVGSCPCILGLITPLAVMLGINKAQRFNAIVKDAEALEKLYEIDTFVFDKTGTLTELSLKTIAPLSNNIDPKSLAALVASLEKDEKHPIAEAIQRSVATQKLPLVKDKKRLPNGITGTIDGRSYTIANETILKENNIPIPLSLNQLLHESKIKREPLLIVLMGNTLIGYVQLHEKIREDAKDFVEELKRLGKQVILLTGSQKYLAEKAAKTLGIHSVYADMSPVEKINFIRSLNKKGLKVAMLGDGANDESALAMSHVNISFLNADPNAIKRSGILLPEKNTYRALQALMQISQKTVANIKQNIFLSMTLGLLSVSAGLGLILFTGIALNPAFAAGLMLLQIIVVVANIYRFKFNQIKPKARLIFKPRSNPKEADTHLLCEIKSELKLAVDDSFGKRVASLDPISETNCENSKLSCSN